MHFFVPYVPKRYQKQDQAHKFTSMAKKTIVATSTSPRCCLDYAFQRIGGKYKGRIIALLSGDPVRYGQLRRCLPDITPKMLTQALRELEADQLVTRHVYLEVPPRVEYSLTPSGAGLLPFIDLLKQWGAEQMRLQGIASV